MIAFLSCSARISSFTMCLALLSAPSFSHSILFFLFVILLLCANYANSSDRLRCFCSLYLRFLLSNRYLQLVIFAHYKYIHRRNRRSLVPKRNLRWAIIVHIIVVCVYVCVFLLIGAKTSIIARVINFMDEKNKELDERKQ